MPEFQPCQDRYHEPLAHYWRKLKARIQHKQHPSQLLQPTPQRYPENPTRVSAWNCEKVQKRASTPK